MEGLNLPRIWVKLIDREIFWLALVGFGLGLFSTINLENSAAAIIALLGVLFAASVISLRAQAEDRWFLLVLFILGFSVRALLAVFLHFFPIVPEWDAYWAYAQPGWFLARFWRGDTLQPPPLANNAYVNINAVIFFIVGYSPLSVKMINCFLGILTSICLYSIAKPIFGRQVASIASVLTAFFPSLVLWSAQNLKDTWIVFFLCLSMLSVNRLRRGWGWRYLFAMVLSFWMLRLLRPLTFDGLMVSLILSVPLMMKSSRNRLLALGGLFSLWFLDFLVLERTGVSPIIKSLAWRPAGAPPPSILGYLQYQLNMVVSGALHFRNMGSQDTAALSVPTLSSWKELLLFMPEALTHYLLRPFPWEKPTSYLAIMTIPEMLAWYTLIPFTVFGMLSAARKRLAEISPILMFTIIFTLLDALAIGNLGAAYRHRTQVWVFLLLFASVGIAHVLSPSARLRTGLSKGRVLRNRRLNRVRKRGANLENPVRGS